MKYVLPFFVSFYLFADKLLIPMDIAQTDHLRAYGVAYSALEKGINVEWLLNFRGGSFMMDYDSAIEKECALGGVLWEIVPASAVLEIYQIIEDNNMETIFLEKAPKIAVYIPDNFEPWDDAVTLALEYAGIPYDQVWDDDVLHGKLDNYDWLHLHHEDFTGQYGKFFTSYHNADWYKEEVRMNEEMAARLGFSKVSHMKRAVAIAVKAYIANGGFIFSMCSACDTYDIGLAAHNTDICAPVYDGDHYESDARSKLDYSQCLAFENFDVVLDPKVYEHSTIDTRIESAARGPNTYFSLFDFSAKFDPVPCMLVQNHTSLVKEFLGQCSGFRRTTIKNSVVILAEVSGSESVKYLHGDYEKGTFTYLAGHDPEDFQHFVNDPPTDLRQHKNSPGYRLILNNVLFPAARKKELKT
ncbi:asparagine synthetase B [candidate division WOR_3 bacterium SM23_60]|uniref:Asparagine synthetase B n=1 Tax=candidate division WOR_3 bacterium SM23_60 TaxID=1703780 RepID=A0A0S8GG73_UNCW3|nr:MAG: asparagine synthetase B [candidate division WOR_3 bacterium SM23_60]